MRAFIEPCIWQVSPSAALLTHLLSLSGEADPYPVFESAEAIVEGYAQSLVAMSDEQAPHIYIFAKASAMYGRHDLGKQVLSRLFESMVLIRGAVAAAGIDPSKVYDYLILRSYDASGEDQDLLANPSQLLASLMLSGEAFGLSAE
jgi:hypothetical protein